MIGFNYRYDLNEEKGTIKLAPTKGMVIASLAPTVFVFGGLAAMGAYALFQDRRRQKKTARQNVRKFN